MKRNPHQFLTGLKIYIVPLGSLSRATWRSKILIERAREAGADFIDQRDHDDDDVIYLACSSVSVAKLRVLFNEECPSHLVKVDWLCDSLDAERKLPLDRYTIDLKEPPSKVARRSPPDSSTALRQREVGLHDERQTAVAGAAEDDSSRGVVDRKPTLDCNRKLSQIFRDLEANLRHNKGSSDEFRSRSYRRAADKIDKLGYPLDTDAAVEHFESECGSGIGAKIMDKIREFVNTGAVKKAEVIGTAERAIGIRELTSVWGVGVSTAEKWYAMGIRSVDALRHSGSIEQLNHNQKIGLKYFEEFNCKIPRQEVEEISTVVLAGVDQATRAKYGGVEHFNVVVCGSYRRGKAMCGDVDFLITHRSRQLTYTENAAILSSIVSCLSEEGAAPSFPQARLTDHLNQYRQHQEHSEESIRMDSAVVEEPSDDDSFDDLDSKGRDKMSSPTYFGVFQLSPKHIHRRVDIKVWSLREYPYALVHFTGSGVFNRRMRYYAKTKLGLKVNDHGIFRSDGSCISCKTERDVFDCLNIKYIDPTMRESETALEMLDSGIKI